MSSQSELLEAVMIVLPYPQHVSRIDLSAADEIRFTWRGDRYRVREEMVEQVREMGSGNMLEGSNLAILMQCLIKRGLIAAMDRKEKAATNEH